MKIIAILSSPSKNGNTAVLARAALRGAKRKGADIEEINLIDYNIQFCNGCMMCMKTGKCSINDDFETLKTKIYKADGIILASPTYGRMPNARMKNFFWDRLGMFTVYTSSLGGKYFLGFSAAGGIGAKKVAKFLAYSGTFGFFKKAYASGYLGVLVGSKDFKSMNRIEDFPDELIKAYKLGEKIVDDFNKKKKYIFQNLIGVITSSLILKRVMKKNLMVNKNGSLKAVYDNLKERGLIKY